MVKWEIINFKITINAYRLQENLITFYYINSQNPLKYKYTHILTMIAKLLHIYDRLIDIKCVYTYISNYIVILYVVGYGGTYYKYVDTNMTL